MSKSFPKLSFRRLYFCKIIVVFFRSPLAACIGFPGDNEKASPREVRNLTAHMTSTMSVDAHLRALCLSVQHIATETIPHGRVRHSLLRSLVLSWMDLQHLLLLNAPAHQLQRLQSLQTTAARQVCFASRHQSTSPLLRSLQLLSVAARTVLKVYSIIFKALHGLPSMYLTDLLEIINSHAT